MNKLATATGLPVSLLMIPLPGRCTEDLPALYTLGRHTLVCAIREDAGQVAWIDPLDALLQAKGSEPLYYRTDHHLTAAGADVVYRALADAWGLRPQQPDSLLESPGFYGSFYARAPTPLIKPDTLTFSLYKGIQVLIDGNDTGGLYDEALLKGRSKYAALLHNNPPRLTLINPEGEGVLLVLRDSYASAMLPAIARHFARVEAIDPRYYSDDLPALCAEQKVERILCIYGLNALTNDRNYPVSRLLFGLTALITALSLAVGALGEYTFPPASQVDYPNYPAPFVPILEEAVPVTYFHDAILVGDSLAEGFLLSGALKDLKVLSKIGQSAAGILNNRGYKLDGKSVDLVTYLHSINPGKIYLWVGSNGIDKYKVSHVIKSYEGMIDLLVTEFPDTLIYCMSVAPVIESRVRKTAQLHQQQSPQVQPGNCAGGGRTQLLLSACIRRLGGRERRAEQG